MKTASNHATRTQLPPTAGAVTLVPSCCGGSSASRRPSRSGRRWLPTRPLDTGQAHQPSDLLPTLANLDLDKTHHSMNYSQQCQRLEAERTSKGWTGHELPLRLARHRRTAPQRAWNSPRSPPAGRIRVHTGRRRRRTPARRPDS